MPSALVIRQNTPAPAQPAPTPAPGAAAPVIAGGGTPGLITTVPTTAAEIAALRSQRTELSNQLSSVAGRREELATDLEGATGSNRAGMEVRLTQLDQRILQIERDIASTGQLIAGARGQLIGDTGNPSGPFDFMRVDLTAIAVVFTIFVLMPLAVTTARNIWRRGSRPATDSRLERENAERLGRLESSVDAIAIEMERVSEGQRFVTKLLAESRGREHARIDAPRD